MLGNCLSLRGGWSMEVIIQIDDLMVLSVLLRAQFLISELIMWFWKRAKENGLSLLWAGL